MVAVHKPPPAGRVHGLQLTFPSVEALHGRFGDGGGLTAEGGHNHGLGEREAQGVRSEAFNLTSTEPPKASGRSLGLAPLPSGLAPLGSLGHHEATRAGHLFEPADSLKDCPRLGGVPMHYARGPAAGVNECVCVGGVCV